MEPTGFEMDDFDKKWDEMDEDDDFYMPHASNPPRRYWDYWEAYGDYQGGYGPGSAGPPPLLGFGGPRPPPFPRMGPPPRMAPPPRMPPPLGFHPGFGPGGPPRMRGPDEARAMQFLTRCGMTREAVRQIPKDLLFLMEPQRCGLCCFEFNTFPLSRIHYMSKAHATAQKKWMTHRPNRAGPKKEAKNGKDPYQKIHLQIVKQAPIKARELYCELCDVQITSKIHGDSHYAGKAHHAVVEGRKNPKNPMLLTPNANKRLEQLIRREKKALAKKPEGEGEKGAEGVVPKKEVKPVDSKYYCNICKTAVTCQEQMTMHMNGKKHLTKEKQHILKMMRGEGEEEDAADAAGENGDGGDKGDNGEGGDKGDNGEGGDKGDNGDGGDKGNDGDGGKEAANGGDCKIETVEKGDNANSEWNESWEDGQTAGQQ